MYRSANELLALCENEGKTLPQAALLNEISLTARSEEAIYARLDETLAVMEASARNTLERPLPTAGGLIEGNAQKQRQYAQTATLLGGHVNRMMAYALSSSETNAAMGRVCAAPTAGACGIVPAVLLALREEYSYTQEDIRSALLVSSAIGALITRNATVAGAAAGCQAECGAAAAMAAGAAAYLRGGTNRQVFDAAAMALINCMGLICDPIAGLVQFPCALRNASQAVNALLSADLALGGTRNLIPFDEAVEAMYRTGRMLPKALRETAMGGVAATATGKRIEKEIYPNG